MLTAAVAGAHRGSRLSSPLELAAALVPELVVRSSPPRSRPISPLELAGGLRRTRAPSSPPEATAAAPDIPAGAHRRARTRDRRGNRALSPRPRSPPELPITLDGAVVELGIAAAVGACTCRSWPPRSRQIPPPEFAVALAPPEVAAALKHYLRRSPPELAVAPAPPGCSSHTARPPQIAGEEERRGEFIGQNKGRRRQLGAGGISPDRARPSVSMALLHQSPTSTVRATKMVQIVYYLSRINGQMEHPHFLELQQLHGQPIRLKDVLERLTRLRGKGMPSLFSWSCKRRYKNGYVWNDLSENDVIFPSDGAEYVLKGSEIIAGCPDFISMSRRASPMMLHKQCTEDEHHEEMDMNDVGAECNVAHAVRPAVATSRQAIPVEVDASPPSSTSSDKAARAETDLPPARSGSMLLQLISCGATATKVMREREAPGGHLARPGGFQFGLSSRFTAAAGGGCRLIHVQAEDKEYFSGSMVESGVTAIRQPQLQRSSSYGEKRASRESGATEASSEQQAASAAEDQEASGATEGVMKAAGKCIPGSWKNKTPAVSSSAKQQQRQSSLPWVVNA